ncbi:hypothetical protein IFM89_018812 [Coptis chinensis]|uniref:WRC domain-containing protein n=1 Tax=Coptis chinensis TaxID=261450 RepID=A0A835GWY4_9MAGN|nr:hypothetical protein IFM89_018812 [Coptis chinensis]
MKRTGSSNGIGRGSKPPLMDQRCNRKQRSKGWQCTGLKFEGNKYCEKHYMMLITEGKEYHCKIRDGKGWHCKESKFEDSDYCERHYLQNIAKKEKEKSMVKRKKMRKGVGERSGKKNRVEEKVENGVELEEEEEEGVGVRKKGLDAILRDSVSKERGNYTTSELILSLKTAFRYKDYEEVVQILEKKEKKLKLEKEVAGNRCSKLLNESEEKKKELVDVKEKLLEIELEKTSLEDEVWRHKRMCGELEEKVVRLEEDHKIVWERERQSQERITTLSGELKKINKNEIEILIVLKNENSDLGCAKRRAENELEVWKERFNELECAKRQEENDIEVSKERLNELERAKRQEENEIGVWKKRFSELETKCELKTACSPQVTIKEEVANCDAKRRAENEIEVGKKRFKEQETNCRLTSAGFPQVKAKEEALNYDPNKVYASANLDFARPSWAKEGGVAQPAEEGKKSESLQRVIQSEANGAAKGASISRDKIKKEDGISTFLLLDSVWAMKPLVGGKEIMKVLQLKDGNDQVVKWVNRLVKWELAYPSGTKQEYLKSQTG